MNAESVAESAGFARFGFELLPQAAVRKASATKGSVRAVNVIRHYIAAVLGAPCLLAGSVREALIGDAGRDRGSDPGRSERDVARRSCRRPPCATGASPPLIAADPNVMLDAAAASGRTAALRSPRAIRSRFDRRARRGDARSRRRRRNRPERASARPVSLFLRTRQCGAEATRRSSRR